VTTSKLASSYDRSSASPTSNRMLRPRFGGELAGDVDQRGGEVHPPDVRTALGRQQRDCAGARRRVE
jgi:hypothetical protein